MTSTPTIRSSSIISSKKSVHITSSLLLSWSVLPLIRTDAISPHWQTRKRATELADFSVRPEQWGDFLCALFDEWVKQDVGTYYIQFFDSTLANWIGEQPGVCSMAKTCGHAGVMEFNGDVYACDHFVFPEYKLGNIYQNTLVEMMYRERQQAFGLMKQNRSPPNAGSANGCLPATVNVQRTALHVQPTVNPD